MVVAIHRLSLSSLKEEPTIHKGRGQYSNFNPNIFSFFPYFKRWNKLDKLKTCGSIMWLQHGVYATLTQKSWKRNTNASQGRFTLP